MVGGIHRRGQASQTQLDGAGRAAPPTKVTPGFGSALLSMYGHAVMELTENGLEYALMVPLCEYPEEPTRHRKPEP